MNLSKRGKKIIQNSFQNEGHFLQDLQHSLLDQINYPQTSINQFQKLYHRKKILSDTIDKYRQKNDYYKHDIQRAKQRIFQIQQLNDKANKQTILMKNQISKINDAHMVSKILMMQKIVKLGMQNQNMERKKTICNQIRQQKNRINLINQTMFLKNQKKRQIGNLESQAIKNYIEQANTQHVEQNKARAASIKSQKQRRKQKILRYQKFKLDQARKNYFSKTQSVRKTLEEKQKLLQTLCLQQLKQEKHFQTTKKVTKQYMKNLSKNKQIQHIQSSLFPTETI